LGETRLVGRRTLQAPERRQRQGRRQYIELDPVTALHLAEKLVGARLSIRDPRRQAWNGNVAGQPVDGIGVTRDAVEVEPGRSERGVETGIEDIGRTVAVEPVDPLRTRDEADAGPEEQARIEAPVRADGAATKGVGQRRRTAIAQHAARAAKPPYPCPHLSCHTSRTSSL